MAIVQIGVSVEMDFTVDEADKDIIDRYKIITHRVWVAQRRQFEYFPLIEFEDGRRISPAEIVLSRRIAPRTIEFNRMISYHDGNPMNCQDRNLGFGELLKNVSERPE